MRKIYLLLVSILLLSAGSIHAQTTLISSTGDGGFETGATLALNGWTGVNSTQSWFVGTSAVTPPSAGTNMGYSSTTAGSWTAATSSSVAHIYRDIIVPVGETKVTVTLKYKTLAIDAGFDFLKVHIVSTSTTPVAGTQLATGQIGVNTDGTTSYATYTFTGAAAAGSQRVVISFKNDGLSPFGAAAIDEISVVSSVPSNITSAGAGGLWSAPGTWSGGVVPTGGDNVTITDGSTVTIDVAAFANSLTVGQGTSGILHYEATTARTLSVNDLTIATGGIFRSAASGSTSTLTTHALSVGGNLTNNGTLNLSATAGAGGTTVNASGALITFTGAANNTFDVSGATLTNLRNSTTSVTLNKGTANTNVLTFTPSASYTSAAGATNVTTTITVGSTTGLSAGMYVFVTSGTGIFAAGTTVTSITNAISFVVSTSPTFSLSASAVVTGSKFAVGSAAAISGIAAGFLTITNGTFEVAGTNAIRNPFFTSGAYSIPATGGFKLNNANAVVTALSASPTNLGLLTIAAGTYNIGTSSGNAMSGATGQYNISGGTLNIGARLTCSGAGSYTQSGGTVNVTTITGGNASGSSGGLDFSSSTSSVNISGGTINLVTANTAGTPLDYRFASSTVSIIGGTLNIGTAATATNFNFRVSGAMPNVVVDNTTNNKTMTLFAASSAYGTTTTNTGATLNLNGFTYTQRGSTFTNNGILTGTTTSSRLSFTSASAQTLAGGGTITTNIDGLSISNTAGVTITHTNQIPTLRVNLFAGTITNSNKLTMGTGAAAAVTTQIGSSGSTTPGGSFDVAPTFNLGTGAYSILYLEETAARTTGFEIPGTRTVTNLTVANNNNVTVAGGLLSLSGILTLSGGKLITTNTNLPTVTNTATSAVVRSSYTSGSLTSSSSGATVTVGSTTGLSAGMTVTVTAGTGAFAANTTVVSILTATTFTVSATPATTLSAATVTGAGGWVSGPIAITLPASLVTGSTYVAPTGKTDYSPLELVNPITNAGGTVVVTSEVFEANAGGAVGTNMQTLNTNKYWASSISAGSVANFTSSQIRITDVTSGQIVSATAIASSASVGGTYDLAGGTVPTVVVGTSVTTQAPALTALPGFFVLGTKAVSMSYVSSTTTQAVTSFIYTNTTNQQIIGLQVVTVGNTNPIDATSFTLNTTGTTNLADITNAKLWYTGLTGTFATTTQFGTTVAAPSGSYNITGTQTLAEGTNYFWLTYDIPNGATINNVVDAEFTSVTAGGVSTPTPTITAPAGTRTIKAQLTGTYTIGASQTAPNYTNLTNAISDLNAYGVSGAVTFQLAGDYASAYVSAAGATSSGTTITVGSTTNLTPGMVVTVTAGVGAFAANTTVTSITNGTTFVVSTTPATALSGGATVVTGSEIYPLTVNAITGGSAANTFTIKPATGVTAAVSGSSATSIFKINGANYVTIDGSNSGGTDKSLTITNTSTAATTAAIWLASTGTGAGAANDVVKNCNINAGSNSTSSTFGIFIGGASISTSGTGADNDNVTIQNNTVTTAYYGIYAAGTAAVSTGGNDGLIITGNTIGSATAANYVILYGIRIQGVITPSITSNTVFNLKNSTLFISPAGIEIGSNVVNGSISKNKINGIYNTNSSGYGAYGIDFSSGTGTTGVTVDNNLIYDIQTLNYSTTSSQYNAFGIRLTGGTNLKLYYNSINLYGSINSGTSAGMSSDIVVTSSGVTGLDLRDNILVNTMNFGVTGSFAYNIYLGATGITFGTINYNDYYGTSGSNTTLSVGYDGIIVRTALSDWKTFTAQDLNSISANPLFNSTSNLQPQLGSPLLNAGTPVSVTTDILGVIRSVATPTIGAYEQAADAVAPTIVYTPLGVTCATTARVLTATITDPSGVPTAGVGLPVLYYKVNAGAYTAVQGVSIGSNQYTFTFGSGTSVNDVISYYIVAQDNAATPNVGSSPSTGASGFTADPPAASTPPTTPSTYTIGTTLSGTYTVGAGGNYTTLTAAVAAYNLGCLAGPVVFSLTDALYAAETFPITINANTGSSSTNTLTIKPTQAATTMSGSSATGLIVLNGADFITIDGSIGSTANTVCPVSSASRDLTFTNNNTGTTSNVIWVSSNGTDGATNNNIINCIIVGNSAAASTLAGIYSGGAGATAATAANNANQYINNKISKCFYGIVTYGVSAAIKNTGTVINQNVMNTVSPNQIGQGGIYVLYNDGVIISGNNIGNISGGGGYAWGISLGLNSTTTTSTAGADVTNATVINNLIGSIRAASTFGVSGIEVAPVTSGTTLIANNMISDAFGNGTLGDIGAGIYIDGGTGSTTNVFYNSIQMASTLTGGSHYNFGVAINGTNPVVNLKNNIITNTGSNGANNNRAIGLAYALPATNLVSNYNDLFVSGTSAAISQTSTLSNTGGVIHTTLTNWQTNSSQDANSKNVAPVFVSATDLHLQNVGGNASLFSAGTPVTVTTDIDCANRGGNPDIGADQVSIAVVAVGVEYFRGTKQGTANFLDWKVNCSSDPSVRLILERSADSRTFKVIQDQNVTAARCAQGFSYTDAAPLAGINYYRLKTISPDGAFRYSMIVALINKDKGFELISVAPNPVKTNTVLSISTVKAGRMSIAVSDMTGKVVMTQNINVIAGNNPVTMNFATLSAGTYNIKVINADNEVKTTRFVKY